MEEVTAGCDCPHPMTCAHTGCAKTRRGPVNPVPKPPLQLTISIPSECEQYAHDIRRFMDAMLYKLKKHSGKGRWQDLSTEKAMELLRAEVVELEDALRDGNRIEIEMEAADVANFGMIVAAIVIERGK